MDFLSNYQLYNNQSDGIYLFDSIADFNNAINIQSNKNITILFKNISNECELNFVIQKNSHVKFLFLQKDASTLQIKGNVETNSELIVYYAEFSSESFKLSTDIHLIGENSRCIWNLASLSRNNDVKVIDVSIYHDVLSTESFINNYGVARDTSKLTFSGICKINNGSHHSKAHQNAKIMVFDESSDAIAKPMLKIDDNDIEASHAAVVGKISDDHLFYLCSRGISLSEARKLITLGYLKPILNGFDDEESKTEIENLINEGL